MIKKSIQIEGAHVLILGLSFKENCPDLRNTRVLDVINELQQYQCKVDVHDPWVSVVEAQVEYGIELVNKPKQHNYDAIILAVAHEAFKAMGAKRIRDLCKSKSVIYDLKYILPIQDSDLRL
jgi:UDP-N-acetyl-D-galactosamine dehydrogenase